MKVILQLYVAYFAYEDLQGKNIKLGVSQLWTEASFLEATI